MKFCKKWNGVLILLVQTVVLTAVTLFCVIPFSCKFSEEGIIFVGGDYVSPVLEAVNVLDEKTVLINFSEKVKPKSMIVSEQLKEISDSSEHSEEIELSPALLAATGGNGIVESEYSVSEDGCIVTCSALSNYEVGKYYEIFGTVEDKAGNSLTFCVPFCGFNSRIPKLVMTEIQPKYKKYKEEYRFEFVEFLALTEGNLSGLELMSAADGESKKYVFPALDVEAGEVFIVHLRNACPGAITETDNLNEATAYHSAKNVRDIWAENDKSRLGESNDIIMLKNSVDGIILDVLMYVTEDATEWTKGMISAAEEVAETGIYEKATVDDAEKNSGLGGAAQNSFHRTNAAELKKRALAGDFIGNEAAYPVLRNSETWTVKKVNPGTL